jgi:hypothetical protein
MAYRKDGKMDRRTTEYQEAVARMAKARKAMSKTRDAGSAKSSTAAAGRRADGRLDQRTAEGKAMATKMAAMRAARGKGKSGGFFSWLFGK